MKTLCFLLAVFIHPIFGSSLSVLEISGEGKPLSSARVKFFDNQEIEITEKGNFKPTKYAWIDIPERSRKVQVSIAGVGSPKIPIPSSGNLLLRLQNIDFEKNDSNSEISLKVKSDTISQAAKGESGFVYLGKLGENNKFLSLYIVDINGDPINAKENKDSYDYVKRTIEESDFIVRADFPLYIRKDFDIVKEKVVKGEGDPIVRAGQFMSVKDVKLTKRNTVYAKVVIEGQTDDVK